MNFEPRDLPPWIMAIVSLGSLLGVVLFGWLRGRFDRDFARTADVTALGVRVQAVEHRIATMPNHEDIRILAARIASVEGGVAVVTEKARGIEQSLGRVEHSVELLVQHQISKANG